MQRHIEPEAETYWSEHRPSDDPARLGPGRPVPRVTGPGRGPAGDRARSARIPGEVLAGLFPTQIPFADGHMLPPEVPGLGVQVEEPQHLASLDPLAQDRAG